MRFEHKWAVMLLGVTGFSASARAQVAAPADPPEAQPAEVRIFVVRDLLAGHPDFPRSGTVIPPSQIGMTANNNPRATTAVQSETERVDMIIKLIEETVAPDTWRDAGGAVGTIRYMDGQFIITQTHANLVAAEKLLADLRANRNRTLALAAHWVLLLPGELEQVTLADSKDAKSPGTLQIVDLAAINKLSSNPPHFVAQVLCLDGQQISVTGGRVKTVVEELTPVVGNGVGMYDAMTTPVQGGVSLEATTTLTPDHTAVLHLNTVYSEWGPLKKNKPQPVPATQPTLPAGAPPASIDRVDMPMSQLKTSVTIPVGKAVVIGGATLEPSTSPKPGDNRRLYLIVLVNVDDKK